MKKEKIILFSIIGVMFIIAFFLGKSCSPNPGIPVELYEKEIKEAGREIKTLENEIRESEAAILEMEAERNGAIDSANTVIADKEEKLRVKDGEIARLEEERREMKDWEAIAKNEKAQKDKWIEKFNIAINSKDSIVAEKNKIIFQLNKKYDDRVKLDNKIIASLREEVEKERRIKEMTQEVADEYRRALNRKKWGNRVTQVVALVFGGYIVYSGVK